MSDNLWECSICDETYEGKASAKVTTTLTLTLTSAKHQFQHQMPVCAKCLGRFADRPNDFPVEIKTATSAWIKKMKEVSQ